MSAEELLANVVYRLDNISKWILTKFGDDESISKEFKCLLEEPLALIEKENEAESDDRNDIDTDVKIEWPRPELNVGSGALDSGLAEATVGAEVPVPCTDPLCNCSKCFKSPTPITLLTIESTGKLNPAPVPVILPVPPAPMPQGIPVEPILVLPTSISAEERAQDQILLDLHGIDPCIVRVIKLPESNPKLPKKQYPCSQCDKRFTRPSHLKRHFLIHTGERPYPCTYCAKTFNLSSTLNVHLQQHTGTSPFQCDICRKGFSDQSHLTIHRYIHTGERPYKCEFCGKRFRQLGNLNSHRQIHMENRIRFMCEEPGCGKGFTRRWNLAIHVRTHR